MRTQYLSAIFFLMVVGACSADAPNLIKNPELKETSSPATPSEWFTAVWGENDARFEYNQLEGQGDSTSLHVSVTSRRSGDAKWWFEPVPVVPGESYRFSDWYKADVESYVVVDFLLENDEHFYLDLNTAERTAVWSEYEDYFEAPERARQLTIFHLLRGVGELSTDSFSLTRVRREGFKRPLLTITFDDGLPENLTTAVPVLTEYQMPATFYFATKFFEGGPFETFREKGKEAIKMLSALGHEVGAHSVSHLDLARVPEEQLLFELEHSKEYLESILLRPVSNFATPYGAYNASVIEAVKNRYRSHRSVDGGFNLKDRFDPYRLVVQNIRVDTTPQQVREWIEHAKRERAWLILVYHRISEHPGEFDTYPAVFLSQVEEIARSSIEVVTVEQALDELMPQRALHDAGT